MIVLQEYFNPSRNPEALSNVYMLLILNQPLFPNMHSCHFKSLVIVAILAIAPGITAQSPVKPQPVPLPGSELRKFHSQIMDQDLLIYVQLPLDYISDGSRKYPVWYMTDANRSFPMTANISTVLGFPPAGFPQLIVVGIAYDIKDMYDWGRWRTRDLTPVADPGTERYWENLISRMSGDTTIRVETGGAPRFLSFICDELIPFIESEYQVSKEDRALGGYSYGGLFSLFALFERPGAFTRYFAGSPSLFYSGRVMFDLEKAFSESHRDLPARLFLSVGELEDSSMIAGVREMADLLESRNYPGLEIRTRIFEGEWHVSAYPASVMSAFTTLYGEE
jgi:predicted alpha/beta superfamily hydrolase